MGDIFKKLVGDILASKSVRIVIGGFIASYLVTKLGLEMETAKTLVDQIYGAVILLVGHQTVVDLASGGKTSASHPDNVAARAAAAKD